MRCAECGSRRDRTRLIYQDDWAKVCQQCKDWLNSLRSDTDKERAAGAFVKNDSGKLRPSTVPPESLLEVIKVFTFGDLKYPNDNYRIGTEWQRYYDALERHTLKWQLGENLDDETDLNHLAHIAANAMILLMMQLNGIGKDTRPALTLKEKPGWKLPKLPKPKEKP